MEYIITNRETKEVVETISVGWLNDYLNLKQDICFAEYPEIFTSPPNPIIIFVSPFNSSSGTNLSPISKI
jgi:hypothetical protein